MTGRELLARRKRRATAFIIAGLALVISGSWLAHLKLIPVAPLLIMLFGGHFLALSLHCLRFFFPCPYCAKVWESLAPDSSLRSLFQIDKRIRYCPFCGFDIDGEIGEGEGKLESGEHWRSVRVPKADFGLPDLQQAGVGNQGRSRPREVLSRGMKEFFLIAFVWLAVIGLLLSLIAHVCGSLGLPQPLGDATWGLHIGVFVVWFPAIMANDRLRKEFKIEDFWGVVWRVCPTQMRLLTEGFGFYALTNFITFAPLLPAGPRAPAPPPPIVFQVFSGHWMAFYSAAAAILYSALVVSKHGPALRCSCRHLVLPSALFCETCGMPVADVAEAPHGLLASNL